MKAMTRERRLACQDLGAAILPVFGAHAQWSRFAEPWHALQCEGDELRDLDYERVFVGDWMRAAAKTRPRSQRTSLDSRKLAQLLSDASWLGGPREANHCGAILSKLVLTQEMKAPQCKMARRGACCAFCSGNRNQVVG